MCAKLAGTSDGWNEGDGHETTCNVSYYTHVSITCLCTALQSACVDDCPERASVCTVIVWTAGRTCSVVPHEVLNPLIPCDQGPDALAIDPQGDCQSTNRQKAGAEHVEHSKRAVFRKPRVDEIGL